MSALVETAQTAERFTRDLQRASGGLGEYHSEHEPVPRSGCAPVTDVRSPP
ncbi:MAG: hypothetical protein QOC69_584 [Mycobacterium sp.]|nr:hypothetical protein [Mycobacterium sp.]